MTKKQVNLCEKLKRMGFAQDKQLKLYGEVFELLGDPIVVGDELVLVDAIEKRSGQLRRIRIPLLIVNMANGGRVAA
jgi:Fe2+ transport system protein FeoA